MAKFYGAIGYAQTIENVSTEYPGVWEENITERYYYGELNRNNRKLQSSDKINDDINIANELSILADPYAIQNFYSMRYVVFQGIKWKITDVEVQYPRLVLSLGGIYNG